MSDVSSSSQDPEAPSSSDGPRLSSNPRLFVILGVVVLLAGLAMPRLLASGTDEGGGPSQGGETAMAVDWVVAEPSTTVERLQTSATLRANESVELIAEASGKVTSIRFEEGARVRAGQLLLTVNDAELQAERRRLEYRLQLAQDRKTRQARLLEKGGVSQEEYDAIANEVSVLEAELDLVEAQIEKAKVRAPFDGTIGLRTVSEGSYISPQTPITTLQSLDPIKLDLSVPEQYASRIESGQSLRFTVRGSDDTFEATVYAVEPQIAPDTRTLPLRARAENAGGQLRPGAFADAELRLGTVSDALMVPAFAVLPTLGGQRLFLVEDGVATLRNVRVGIRTDSTVQIADGIAPGDTVITSGIQDLRAGLPVTPKTP